MKVYQDSRGLHRILHPRCPSGEVGALVAESSAWRPDGDYSPRPGGSCLRIEGAYHLDKDEVSELVYHLRLWLSTGCLAGRIDRAGGEAE